jgi:hypothetical protein
VLMGMMGLYIGRIYDEVKARPLYVVRDAQGLSSLGTPEHVERLTIRD